MSVQTFFIALSLLTSIASLVLTLRAGTMPNITRDLRELQAELVDVDDRVTMWMKRENVRRARDAKEDKAELTAAPGPRTNSFDKKAAIRARIAERNG